jgi:methionyl-tRNA formyltransferase
MKNISNKIVFFGTDKFSVLPLTRLIEDGFDIAAVITKPDYAKNRHLVVTPPEVKTIAARHGITVLQPTKLTDIKNHLETLNQPLGILVSYGKLIPQTIIDLFPFGIINIHPSLLPFYRGPSPIETAILNGDKETGVSIMKLTAEMDAGPIFVQKPIDLTGNESKDDLYERLASLGIETLINNLPEIISGTMAPYPQDDSKATYCHRLDKSMSVLNTSTKTALECYNQVRAFLGFPKSKLVIENLNCTITEVSVSDQPKSAVDQRCKDGQYLIIKRLIPPGSKEMSAQDFINGFINRK